MTFLELYATKILSGEIKSGNRIKQVYTMLLDKLKNPENYKPYFFDEKKANRAIDFIEKFCKQAQGKTGTPLLLDLFQKAMLQAIFGFVDSKGLRQYNEALVIIGRKNGKTTLLAAIALYLTVADGEGSPETYFIARLVAM